MKSLLLLSLIGAASYAVLLLSNPHLPAPNANAVAAHTQDSRPAVIHPSSWASDLRSLRPQVASDDRPPTRWYERKPRRILPTIDDDAVAESQPEAETLAAPPKPKAVKAASRKAKWRAGSAQAEISDRVVRKSELKRPRWTRRAERRTRKAFSPNRAFLLGR